MPKKTGQKRGSRIVKAAPRLLPSESAFKLYRAMGPEAFIQVLGWRPSATHLLNGVAVNFGFMIPSDSVLKLYRSMGVEAFAQVMGWERAAPESDFVLVPAEQFATFDDLREFCKTWDLVVFLKGPDFRGRIADFKYMDNRDGKFGLYLRQLND